MKCNHISRLVFLITLMGSLNTNAFQINNDVEAKSVFARGVKYNDKKAYDSAMMLLNESSAYFLKSNNPFGYLKSQIEINYALMRMEKYDQSIKLLNQSLNAIRLSPQTDTLVASIYKRIGRSQYELGHYFDAKKNYLIAMEIYLRLYGENHKKTAAMHNSLSNTFRHLADLDKSLEHANQAVKIAEYVLTPEDPDYSGYYHSLGYVYYKMSQPDNAIKYYQKSLKIRLDNFGLMHRFVADSYLNLGTAYNQKGNYTRTLEYTYKALEIYKYLYGPEHNRVASTYNNIGLQLRKMGDFAQSKLYHQTAIELKVKIYGDMHPTLSKYYYNMGRTLEWEKKYEEALEYYNHALKIDKNAYGENHPEVAGMYGTIGALNHLMGDDEKGLENLKIGLALQLRTAGENNHNTPSFYANLGNIYQDNQNFSEAKRYLLKSSEIQKNIHGKYHPELARNYNQLAEIELIEGNLKKATSWNDMAYSSLNPLLDDMLSLQDPELEFISQKNELISILAMRAQISRKAYEESGQKFELIGALDNYELATALMRNLQNDFYLKNSFQNTPEKFMSIFEGAIEVALKLYNQTEEFKYFEQAFSYTEQSKSITLTANIHDNYAKSFAGVPSDLIELENDLNAEVLYFTNLIVKAESGDEKSKDAQNLINWRNKLVVTKSKKDSLVAEIEEHYPSYYELKYNQELVTANTLMTSKLDDDETIITYFLGEDRIYILALNKNQFVAKSIEINDIFYDNIIALRKALENKSNDVKLFNTISNELHQQLIAPVLSEIDAKHLIIIPDGILGYLPFELLTKSISKSPSYSNLEYLIRDYQINYAYTVNFWSINKSSESKAVENYLALAPTFSNELQENNPLLLASNDLVRDQLVALRGSHKEVASIANFSSGRFLRGVDATEKTFKENASNYGILHLATHAIVDDENPMNSRLIFTQNEDSLEDGNLYTWELYNLHLNAKMAVLSACNTGYGKVQRGEGVMSLGRAFAYAGCPSIIMSLWPAQDETTAEIMELFYLFIAQGHSKDKSMQLAKMEFLDNKNELFSHPYYWAGFVVQGDASPLKIKKANHFYHWLIVWLPIIFMTLIYIIVLKNNKKE